MKCPNCGGKGKYKNGFGKIGVCYYCLGTGKVNDKCERVKTEQEYIQTCNTEQLAEFLTKVILDDKRFRMTMVGGVNETKLWLKQPHTNEETK